MNKNKNISSFYFDLISGCMVVLFLGKAKRQEEMKRHQKLLPNFKPFVLFTIIIMVCLGLILIHCLTNKTKHIHVSMFTLREVNPTFSYIPTFTTNMFNKDFCMYHSLNGSMALCCMKWTAIPFCYFSNICSSTYISEELMALI